MVVNKLENKQYSLNCNISEFEQYGIELRLFFEFLKYSIIAFFVMSIISIPSLVKIFNQSDNDPYFEISIFSKFSLSNQPFLILENIPEQSTEQEKQQIIQINKQQANIYVQESVKKYKKNIYFLLKKHIRLLWAAIPDIINCFFFFFFIYFLRFKRKQIYSKRKHAQPSDYAIEITGFPKFINQEYIIHEHFQKNLNVDVFECYLVRKYFSFLTLYKQKQLIYDKIKAKKQKLKQKNEKESQKLNKLIEKQQKIKTELQNKYSLITNKKQMFQSKKAFLIIDKHSQKQMLKNEYKKQWNFYFCNNYSDNFKLFGQYPLKINFKPDEPSNILWENIEVSKSRNFISTLTSILLMFCTFGIILIANIAQPQKKYNCKQILNMTKECQCQNYSYSNIMENNQIKEMCYDILVQYYTVQALNIIMGIIIWVINLVNQIIIIKLVKFNKYKTVTKETTLTLIKIFLSFFINTSIIPLLSQANIFGIIPSIYVSYFIPPLKQVQEDKKDQFSIDFDRKWYDLVGFKIICTVLISLIVSIIKNILLLPIFKCLNTLKVYFVTIKSSQKEANEKIIDQNFYIILYYAQSLNIIFTCLFYSSGMPILLLIGGLNLLVQYWFCKYTILRICKYPPIYDKSLSRSVFNIVPFALFFHLCIGIYMYSQPQIFPQNIEDLNLNKEYQLEDQENNIKNRAFKLIYLFIILFIILGLDLLNRIFFSPWIFSKLFFRAKNNVFNYKPYQDFYQKISGHMLQTYNIKSNLKYKSIVQTIENHINGDNFEENYDEQKQDNINFENININLQN
ncbi:hypothetical protein IMG5_000810 [Ichthyophthirius multifiliis]|uniref:CSC1/OSCA1-like 7TM region domain-containing protein n=1 Tax=Ichthyophthirius multifiliis TaxID=5932 RepID=G0QIW8_ICHMU|nr:hypothetical protein IMG5_000810 [Ichthyophthirius multifiliis]EGR34853.1 hypothetical protein IMG5_000810 [Ichthyophthirius multifiliis]|eukprot:XP_004040157.1 hypothetical protein IMG5_000810 [Ichthyophthirius multifiliis]